LSARWSRGGGAIASLESDGAANGRASDRGARESETALAALGSPLSRDFYARPAPALARALIGRLLVRESPEGIAGGLVVEVEAYRGAADPASHAYRGPTARNAVMFGPAGHAYVYFTYGMHYCVNVVAGRPGRAEAVLVRALEPTLGLELMGSRRRGVESARFARGPACVTRALGIGRESNGVDLVDGPLWISDRAPDRRGFSIERGARIGIRSGLDLPWRFFLAGHPCVSGPRSGSAGLPGVAAVRRAGRVRR
jgi:DNA-3-methyladenine glycosylase